MNGISAPVRQLREASAASGHEMFPERPDGVIATIFRHEVSLAVTSFRLWLPALLLLVLMVLSAVTSAARRQEGAAAHRDLQKAYAATLAGASVDDLTEVGHPALKPPWRLALVLDGGQSAAPDLYRLPLSALEVPELGRAAEADPRLPAGAPLDWMFAIRIVLSIGAFLLCHGAVCNERQAGTLKLLFSDRKSVV